MIPLVVELTGTNETDGEEKQLCGNRPEFIICRDQSCGRQETTWKPVAQCLPKAGSSQHSRGSRSPFRKKQTDAQVPAQFGIFPDHFPVSFHHMVVEHEGHSAQHHENDRIVEIGVPIMATVWGKPAVATVLKAWQIESNQFIPPESKQKDIDPVDDRVKNP